MHEFSMINSLLNKVKQIATDNDAQSVSSVNVRIGALAHISADHFREHFIAGSRGTIMESAELVIEESADTDDPEAQSILLISIGVD